MIVHLLLVGLALLVLICSTYGIMRTVDASPTNRLSVTISVTAIGISLVSLGINIGMAVGR